MATCLLSSLLHLTQRMVLSSIDVRLIALCAQTTEAQDMTGSTHSLGWAFSNVKVDCSPLGTSMSSASAVGAQKRKEPQAVHTHIGER